MNWCSNALHFNYDLTLCCEVGRCEVVGWGGAATMVLRFGALAVRQHRHWLNRADSYLLTAGAIIDDPMLSPGAG